MDAETQGGTPADLPPAQAGEVDSDEDGMGGEDIPGEEVRDDTEDWEALMANTTQDEMPLQPDDLPYDEAVRLAMAQSEATRREEEERLWAGTAWALQVSANEAGLPPPAPGTPPH